MDLNGIARYIQHLAINPSDAPSDEVYNRDFNGMAATGDWLRDTVSLCDKLGIKPLDIKRQLEGVGVPLGAKKSPDTAGMRRQYVIDCFRAKKTIDLSAVV